MPQICSNSPNGCFAAGPRFCSSFRSRLCWPRREGWRVVEFLILLRLVGLPPRSKTAVRFCHKKHSSKHAGRTWQLRNSPFPAAASSELMSSLDPTGGREPNMAYLRNISLSRPDTAQGAAFICSWVQGSSWSLWGVFRLSPASGESPTRVEARQRPAGVWKRWQ